MAPWLNLVWVSGLVKDHVRKVEQMQDDDGYTSPKQTKGLQLWLARWPWIARGLCEESWTDGVMRDTSALEHKFSV